MTDTTICSATDCFREPVAAITVDLVMEEGMEQVTYHLCPGHLVIVQFTMEVARQHDAGQMVDVMSGLLFEREQQVYAIKQVISPELAQHWADYSFEVDRNNERVAGEFVYCAGREEVFHATQLHAKTKNDLGWCNDPRLHHAVHVGRRLDVRPPTDAEMEQINEFTPGPQEGT